MAGCRITLSRSKIKVRISETKYRSFYKTLTNELHFSKLILKENRQLIMPLWKDQGPRDIYKMKHVDSHLVTFFWLSFCQTKSHTDIAQPILKQILVSWLVLWLHLKVKKEKRSHKIKKSSAPSRYPWLGLYPICTSFDISQNIKIIRLIIVLSKRSQTLSSIQILCIAKLKFATICNKKFEWSNEPEAKDTVVLIILQLFCGEFAWALIAAMPLNDMWKYKWEKTK